MEIFRFLISIIIVFSLFQCTNQLTNSYLDYYENEYYIIKKEQNNSSYVSLLKDTTISKDGAYIYKGKKDSPFSNNFNDETGIFIKINKNESYEILLFDILDKEAHRYVGKVILKNVEYLKEIKIEKTDLGKVFASSVYKIIIVKNEIPILKYSLFLIN